MSASDCRFASTPTHLAYTLYLLTPRYLADNQFTGSIDALGKLTKLTYLCVRAGMDDVATLLVVSLYTCGRFEMSAPISVDR